jgi:hypothetical protein
MRLVMRRIVIWKRRRFMYWWLVPGLGVRVRPAGACRATSAVLTDIVAHT